jgi:hypothetical protein
MDGAVDAGRSGLTLTFDRSDYLDRLASRTNYDPVARVVEELSQTNPRIQGARQVNFLEQYRTLVRSPDYRRMYREAQQVADSLRGFVSSEFDTRSRMLIERKARLDSLGDHYGVVLERVRALDPELRRRGTAVLDSLRRDLEGRREELLLRHLREEGRLRDKANEKVSGLKRLLLNARRFSIGNTRLPDDGLTSIGLPIRGLHYAYEREGLSVDLSLGSRIQSRRITPREGLAFHDLHRGFRVGRLAVGYTTNRSQIELAVLAGSQQRQRESEVARRGRAGVGLPTPNRTVTLQGQTGLSERLKLVTTISHASQVTGTGGVPGSVPALLDSAATHTGAGTVPALAVEAGLRWNAQPLDVTATAFRMGSAYRTLANPYLYTDYQGLELEVTTRRLARVVQASFSLAGGRGTTIATRNNVRLRMLGSLAAFPTSTTTLQLVVSPNVYRYQVTGQEGLVESSIFQFSLNQLGQLASRPLRFYLGASNLQQGMTWADSTTASATVVLTGDISLSLSESITFAANGQQQLAAGHEKQTTAAGGFRYNYGGKIVLGRSYRIGLGVRYGRLVGAERGGWGGECDLTLPLTPWAVVRASLFYRPAADTSPAAGTAPLTIPSILSQQSWQGSL